MEYLLAVASLQGCDSLVLGAWGCGVFRNDPEMVAHLFREALVSERLRGCFRAIRFSVLDKPDGSTIVAFESCFRH